MSSLLDTVLHLDDHAEITDLIDFIQNGSHDLQEMLLAVPELLIQRRLRPAFVLAMVLKNNHYYNPILSATLSLGGWIFNSPEEEQFGLTLLQAQADALPVSQRQLIHDELLQPILSQQLEMALEQADNGRVLRLLATCKGLFPPLRTRFDWHAPVPAMALAERRTRGRAEAKWLSHLLPPAGTPRPRRRVVVAMRERFYFGNPTSRLSDFGPRIIAAMEDYGWEVIACPFRCATLTEMEDDCHAIVESCRHHQAELLVIDLNVTIRAEVRDRMIGQLRRENGAIRVVGCLIDGYCFPDDVLTEASRELDLLWTRDVPARPLWRRPDLASRVLNLAFPHAGLCGIPERPLIPKPLFAGGITAQYVPHRAFWLAAIEQMGLPIRFRLSTHQEDGLSPLDSFALYMQDLAEATCCLNLSMRFDQSHVVTFRSFEVILSGALLVQEATPEMDHYFVEGEHYLAFSTLAELASVVRFITDHPEEAEAIRRCGNAFAREHYSDEKIIGHLDRRLFFSAREHRFGQNQG